MEYVDLNYLAIFVAALINMVVGGLWYSPLLFGKIWMKEMKINPSEMQKHSASATRGYIGAFIGSLISSYVLAHFVSYMGAATFVEGMETSFWIWLGFIVPVLASSVWWEGKSWALYFINIANYLVALGLMGGLLAAWPA